MASDVFFARTGDNPDVKTQVEATRKICNALDISSSLEKKEYVAIKLHVGDKYNTTHVRPEIIKVIVEIAKEKEALPFMTETSTLYRGERENAVSHIMHAISHGFTVQNVGAPFIMADGLVGDAETEVMIEGELFNSVQVAREIRMIDCLVVVSHMTGHIAAGFGATIKNLGMGLSSRKGKLRQHSSITSAVIEEKCAFCKKCMKWCPQDAIYEKEGKARIDTLKCIGCGECFLVCRFDAISFNWGTELNCMQKAMAEHALGVVKDKKAFYLNVLIGMTTDCDCFAKNQEKVIPDVGIIGSLDPVAVDQAGIDLTIQADQKNLNQLSYPHINGAIQLEHAEKIKLGTREYRLIEV